jgi:mRNA deadenylase 3'-5' endonuclease subunit Ccr4
LRNSQAAEIVMEINILLDKFGRDIPVIFCGDMNGPPSEPFYSTIINSSIKFKSVYNQLMPLSSSHTCSSGDIEGVKLYASGEPPMTTWKVRDNGQEKKATIDYIFFSDNASLESKEVYKLPDTSDLGSVIGLPSTRYPSDHLAIACRFAWA